MDKDLKDSIKKIQKKRERYERLEKIVIFFTGVIAILIFLIIGLNVYSGLSEKVSEPEINIVENENVTKSIPIAKKEENKEKNISSVNKEQKIFKNQKTEKPKTEKKVAKVESKKENPKVTIFTPPKLEIPKKEISEPKKQVKTATFYTIQIGAFKTQKNAEKHIKKHKLQNAFVIKEKNFYKVMVGKFKTKKEAITYMKKHKLKGFLKKIKS